MRKIFFLTVLGMLMSTALCAQSSPSVNPLVGFEPSVVYLQSFNSGKVAAAANVSIPLAEYGRVSLRFDTLVLSNADFVQMAWGGSVKLKGLSVGDVSFGLAYVPADNYRLTGYIGLIPIKF